MDNVVSETLQTVLRKSLFSGMKWAGHRPGRVIRNLHYGRESRQQLDIYLAAGQFRGPHLVFFHGGGWTSGHKNEYAFIGNALSAFGVNCAVVGYRLYPRVRYPAFVEDAALAVGWLQREGARYGFGNGPLYLMGHSAGGHIACLLALDERYRQLTQLDMERIGGVIGLAGAYRFRPENDPVHSQIFAAAGPDFASAKPVHHVARDKAPLLLLHGSNDATVPLRTAQRMFDAASAVGQPVQLHVQSGYGHVRPLFDFLPFMPNHQKTMALLLSFMANNPPPRGYPPGG